MSDSGSCLRGLAGAGPCREGIGGGTRDELEATDCDGARDRLGNAGTLKVSLGRLGPALLGAGIESGFAFTSSSCVFVLAIGAADADWSWSWSG